MNRNELIWQKMHNPNTVSIQSGSMFSFYVNVRVNVINNVVYSENAFCNEVQYTVFFAPIKIMIMKIDIFSSAVFPS